MKLDFFQIFYEESQRSELYSFATPFKNEILTDYFENKCIADLVPKSTGDYIGVASWRLRQKRQDGFCPMILKIYSNDDLSEQKILKGFEGGVDVVNLRPFSRGHKMLHMAQVYHGGSLHGYAWENAIEELRTIIEIPEEVKTPIYENAFISSRSIYIDYVCNCLIPVMDYMRDKPVFFVDSGYARKKERTDPKAVEVYRAKTSRLDWPLAPFILERLFSIWINDKQFKVINL